MECTHCGSVYADELKFCGHCGTPAPDIDSQKRTTLLVTPAPLDVGEVVDGRYRVIGQLGAGGMGTVFAAHEAALDRVVAIKVLAADLATNQDFLARFELEAKAMAKLEHPNIAPVYGVGRHRGLPYIAMKKLDGVPLSRRKRMSPPLSAVELVDVVKQVGSALTFLHSHKFIHRDIKSGNIFLGTDGHAWLLDFGILRGPQSSVTRTGLYVGTVPYMSPEQALGWKDLDYRVDLYALAIVIYEALAGRRPFESDNEFELIHAAAKAPPPDVRIFAPDVPAPVAAVLAQGLAKNREERFQSGQELALALETAYQVPSPPSVPNNVDVPLDTVTGRRSAAKDLEVPLEAGAGREPTPKKRSRWVAGGVAAAVGALALVGVSLAPGRPSRSSDPVADRPPPPPAVLPAESVASPPPVVLAPPPTSASPANPASKSAPPLVVPVEAPSEPAVTSGSAAEPKRAHHLTRRAPAPATSPAPAPAPLAPAAQAAPGLLNLDCTPWANVFIDGSSVGQTPIIQMSLSAGSHSIKLVNPDRGLSKTLSVEIAAGKATTRREGL